ncbi:SIS domain-containing protein [Rhodococcus hoagii]|nr:SIS domain-containing protein [Prescottella equi]
MHTSVMDPPVGTVLATIRARASSLAPSEGRVANVCVDRASEVAWWSTVELADAARTSTATVVRACQNLGFTGFQHLRMLMLRDLGAAFSTPKGAKTTAQTGIEMVQSMFDDVALDLSGALGTLDVEVFDAAVAALVSAGRILFVANGASAPSAAAMAIRFVANGRAVELPPDSIVQQIAARHLSADDVCLAVSASGMNGHTLAAVRAAREAGATVIGVTGNSRSKLLELATIPLFVGESARSRNAQGISPRVVQMSFLIGLEMAVQSASGGSPEAAGRSMEQVVGLLDSPGLPDR